MILDRRDRIFWGATFGALLGVTTLLYLAAFVLPTDGTRFSGFILDSHDGWSYVAWARAFSEGGWLADLPTNLGSPRPHFFNLVWFTVGKLMQVTGIPFLVFWYLLGILAGGSFYYLLLGFMRGFFRDRLMAWTAYLLAGFATGFGWLIYLFSPDFAGGRLFTNDVAHGEGFPIHCFWTFPHLSLSWLLLVAIYLFMIRAALERTVRWAFAAAATALVMGFCHPFSFVTILPVLGSWYLVLTVKHGRPFLRRWWDLAVLAAGMAPGLFFYWRMVYGGAAPEVWQGVNVNRSAGLPALLLGFGPLVLPAVLGHRGFAPLRGLSDRYLLVALWAPINLALHFSYPLLNFEARLAQGLILPLAILATWGFFGHVLPVFRRRAQDPSLEADIAEGSEDGRIPPAEDTTPGRWRWTVALVLCTLPTTAVLMNHQLRVVVTRHSIMQHTLDSMIVLHEAERAALEELSARIPRGSLVLSEDKLGLVIPAFAAVRVLVGHKLQTPNYEWRAASIIRFFGRTATTEGRRRVLADTGADFVWYGFGERQMGGPPLDGLPFLQMVFNNGSIQIYKVLKERVYARGG